VGIPDVTVQAVVDAVTQPAGKFAYDGALGLILASKYPLQAREFQDFIDDSTSNHRGALYAEIELNKQTHVVACTHPTANLSIEYPASGKHGSWEGENRFMQEQMIAFANAKAGGNPILFGGDFNCSIANPATAVDGEFAANCQLWRDNGFSDPAAEQLPCTFCYEENLLLQPEGNRGGTQLDHVFIKNLDASARTVARRIFDDPVSIEALVPPSELEPEESPKLTHPSDHYGVEVKITF
jgi:endonuclease/exonuclease/phosphatase family metal-dependent hydrolase